METSKENCIQLFMAEFSFRGLCPQNFEQDRNFYMSWRNDVQVNAQAPVVLEK